MVELLDLPNLVCVRRINEGGGPDYGSADEVYVALRISDCVEVAVRIFQQHIVSARDRVRFDQEIAAIQKLQGEPYVVSYQDAGVSESGQAYIVTDYCASGSLNDHLAAVGRFTPAEVRRIGVKLAGALARAHELDVYHRNLKPSNVLIDDEGEPVLSDFGLITLATTNGDFGPPLPAGQRAYVAPEGYLPELMEVASDIYSLGATLYALLAGRAPRTVDPLAVAVDGDTVADLPRVPWALMSVLRRAMAIDPRDRFADADEMQRALAHGS